MSTVQLQAKLIWLQAQVDKALQDVAQKKQIESLLPKEREALRIEIVRAKNSQLAPYFDEALKGMIDDEEPPSAEELQAALIADGIKPGENLLSRMLIEAREESLA